MQLGAILDVDIGAVVARIQLASCAQFQGAVRYGGVAAIAVIGGQGQGACASHGQGRGRTGDGAHTTRCAGTEGDRLQCINTLQPQVGSTGCEAVDACSSAYRAIYGEGTNTGLYLHIMGRLCCT